MNKLEKPEEGYCCTNDEMYQITDEDGEIVGYICSGCKTIYKYELVKEND